MCRLFIRLKIQNVIFLESVMSVNSCMAISNEDDGGFTEDDDGYLTKVVLITRGAG